jgi:hypothetical protein
MLDAGLNDFTEEDLVKCNGLWIGNNKERFLEGGSE